MRGMMYEALSLFVFVFLWVSFNPIERALFYVNLPFRVCF